MTGLRLERDSSEPIYQQIAEQLRSQIASGALPLGCRLPTVRSLAGSLDVARQTVLEAYRLLGSWGLTEARVGDGTRVVRELPSAEARERLAALLASGPMADYEPLSSAGGLRSLATAVPDPALFLHDEFLAEIAELRNASPWAFYYAPPAGLPELRYALARERETAEAELLVTLGANHAIGLLLDELCSPGDQILVEEPGFLGMESFLTMRGLVAVRAPSGSAGLDLDALRSLVKGVKAILCWPSFGPATGSLAPLETRREIVRLAEERGIYVVEDAHYRPIAFYGQPPRLRSLSRSRFVVEVDSLSGYLAPGLRAGWVIADRELIGRLEQRVRGTGSAGLGFSQLALAGYLRKGRLAAHLERVIPRYRARRAALTSGLRFEWPDESAWFEPLGGLSVWVTLPTGGRYEDLYEQSLIRGVPFAPGALFGAPSNTLRLSFGTQRPESIQEAMAILGRLVRDRVR
ncbi:PLP-dependent aminotransferase family protein [Fimbriimonas ginsengisoli]|uniref:Putative transcriptional regulator, GntR family n=1 Tax=Fimbriimonas ginsengisoli Gsoil 348 TaxID=661478 RepID=A0A068NM46_FIMGI|nr:PLP-dependent aminotransferase family protein [Fimbriimonas ginsengisoli]AIE84492.1 putative transcriptional regulator, GntR family [Fimbriimonas ginsengisoli Gsoil 348]